MLCFAAAAAAVVLDYDGESAQGAMSAILSFNDADCCRRRNFLFLFYIFCNIFAAAFSYSKDKRGHSGWVSGFRRSEKALEKPKNFKYVVSNSSTG